MAQLSSHERDGYKFTAIILTFLLVLGAALPLPALFGYSIYPYMAVMAVFYWSVHTPSHARPLLLFVLGLFADSLSGVPLGANALVLLGVRGVLIAQRRVFLAQPFVFVWTAAGFVVFLASCLLWLILSVHQQHVLGFLPFFLPVLSSMIFYPILHNLLGACMGKKEAI